MDAFFKGKYVTLQDADGENVEIYMTPWTVREYIDFMEKNDRILAKYDGREWETNTQMANLLFPVLKKHVLLLEDTSIFKIFWNTLSGKRRRTINHLVFNELIVAFTDLNFGAGAPGTKRKSPKIEDKKLLSIVFDFLISQGHRFSEIMKYRLPQFLAFQDAACERLSNMYGGKKEKETEDIGLTETLCKMGVARG